MRSGFPYRRDVPGGAQPAAQRPECIAVFIR